MAGVADSGSVAGVTDGPPGICFDDVRFAWPDGELLFGGLELTAPPGSIVALVGASGCGKSTALRLAAGLLQPSSGRVSAAEGDRAFVFQAPTLLPWRSLRANVELPLELRGVAGPERRSRAVDVLEAVGLGTALEKLPHELSGGMQMRASVARALVTHPALLCLDEPFGALDALTRRRLHGVFLDVWRRRRPTVLLVTHDIDEAIYLSDVVYVLAEAAGGGAVAAPHRFEVPLPRPRRPAHRHDDALAALSVQLEEVLGA